jgi:lipid II:glycine glycyltransferase (peptidoglycan interpeptide bridge formation enzyme)
MLTATGREAGATLVRWDVPWDVERGAPKSALTAAGLRPAPIRVQPPDTVIVPLGGGEDAVLAAMKSKTRYNVRVAGRKGVTVSAATGAAALTVLPEWYRLYEETARRDAITIHPLSYYRRVIEYAVTPGGVGSAAGGGAGGGAASREVARGLAAAEDAPRLTLYTAHHEDDLLGGIIVASWQGVSTYLYGASADVKRNLMGAYLLQWEAMRHAMAAGDHSYDLFGIPPTDDPAHPMHGLYRFKTGFGGRVFHRAGAWDRILRPVPAALYRRAELLRGWYYYRVRKQIARRA